MRSRPASWQEALSRQTVSLVDITVVTGLSYGTIRNDVREGYLRAVKHQRGTRAHYRVTRSELGRYLASLGYPVREGPTGSSTMS